MWKPVFLQLEERHLRKVKIKNSLLEFGNRKRQADGSWISITLLAAAIVSERWVICRLRILQLCIQKVAFSKETAAFLYFFKVKFSLELCNRLVEVLPCFLIYTIDFPDGKDGRAPQPSRGHRPVLACEPAEAVSCQCSWAVHRYPLSLWRGTVCVDIKWIGLIVAEADVKWSGFIVKQTRSTHKSDRAVSSGGVVASRWGELMHWLLLDLQAL